MGATLNLDDSAQTQWINVNIVFENPFDTSHTAVRAILRESGDIARM